MKNLLLCFFLILGMLACDKQEVSIVNSACIESKVDAMRTANKAYTSVKRFTKNGESFWLFDTGSAFDAPQFMLNANCDTVCKWCFCTTRLPCQSDFNLGDSTAVTIWKY